MFMESMEKVINNDFNYAFTENGGLGYKTSGKKLLDFNFIVPSLRKVNEENIRKRFFEVFCEDPELATKYIFFARDIREGLGERRLFRICFKELMKRTDASSLIKFIPKYGRWDDVIDIYLEDKKYDKIIVELIEKTLADDLLNMVNNNNISLCAKWMPSINSTNVNRKNKAFHLAKDLGMNHKTYRQTLSRLRNYLNIVETKMCNKEWNLIDYNFVPSKANLLYKNAFLRNDKERRLEYLENLNNGKAKINSSVCFPHEIVHKYRNKYDETLESMWKSLPDLVGGDENVLVVADGSGSMYVSIDHNSNVRAIEVANSLAIYFSERSSGQFKDKYITFSSNPRIVNFENCENLRDKIELALNYCECSNTNIERTFKLILNTAVDNHMKQSELPKTVLIISDMEFDYMTCGDTSKRMFDNLDYMFKEKGYLMPKLVFWNVNSRSNTIPVRENENGVSLVSGFSPNIVKMVLSNKLDPYEILLEQLMSDRYKEITLKK